MVQGRCDDTLIAAQDGCVPPASNHMLMVNTLHRCSSAQLMRQHQLYSLGSYTEHISARRPMDLIKTTENEFEYDAMTITRTITHAGENKQVHVLAWICSNPARGCVRPLRRY